MTIIRVEDSKFVEGKATSRKSKTDFHQYLTGRTGEPDNFMLVLYYTDSEYETPRHRHNFDQIRFQVEGDEYDYARNGKLKLGHVGYFPEGTYYGPSKSGNKVATLLLQIGGMSGQGYMSQEENYAAAAELRKKGEFHDGIFSWRDEHGQKHNQDGYEACWEFSRQQRLEYPDEHFQAPVFMDPAAFVWEPYDQVGNVEHKLLGCFGEGGGMKLGFLRIAPGGVIPAAIERTFFFVVSGRGHSNGQLWTERSVIYVNRGEVCDLAAENVATLFYIGMPDHALIPKLVRKPFAKTPPRLVEA